MDLAKPHLLYALVGALSVFGGAGCGGSDGDGEENSADPAPSSAGESAAPVGAAASPAEGEESPEATPAAETAAPTDPLAIDIEALPAPAEAPPACEGDGGDARAMRGRLRTMARTPEDAPPSEEDLMSGCALTRHDVARGLNRGAMRHHRAHEYTKSAAWFARAVEIDPSYHSARFNLACALAQQERYLEAAQLIGQLHTSARVEEGERTWMERVLRDRDFRTARNRGEFWEALGEIPNGPSLAPSALRFLPDGTDGSRTFSGEDMAPNGRREGLPDVTRTATDALWSRLEVGDGAYSTLARAFDSRTIRTYRDSERFSELELDAITGFMAWAPFPDIELHVFPLDGENGLLLAIASPDIGHYGLVITGDEMASRSGGSDFQFVVSRDRRAIGWLSVDAEGTPTYGCLYYAENGAATALSERCGSFPAPEEDEDGEEGEGETVDESAPADESAEAPDAEAEGATSESAAATPTPAPGSPSPGSPSPAPGSPSPAPGSPSPGSPSPAPGSPSPAPGSPSPAAGTPTPAPAETATP